MNKSVLVMLAMGTIAVILVGSMVYSSTVYASSQERRDCYNRYMPQDETGYRICIGEIGTPDPNHSGG
ncbi:MAG TPA: hypothetical protein VH796_13305 [Nitrososphaeraceae archaeon]|jgi:hypothetical protein